MVIGIGGRLKVSRLTLAASWIILSWASKFSGVAQADTIYGPAPASTGDEGRTFIPFVSTSAYYNSNLFALENNQDAINALGSTQISDYVMSYSAGLALLDWKPGRQEFVGHAIINRSLYNTYSQLDNTSRDLALQWNWKLGRIFLGDMGVTDITQLGNLTYIQQPLNDIFTTRTAYFNGYAKINELWRLNIGSTEGSYSNSVTSQQLYNLNLNSISGGVQYLEQTGKEVDWVSTQTNGSYPKLIYNAIVPVTDKFIQYDNGPKFVWGYSDKTLWLGNLNYTRHISPDDPAQNYSGFTGKLEMKWALAGKTQLDLSGYRTIAPYDTATTGYQVVKGASLVMKWNAVDKIAMTLRMHSDIIDYPLDSSAGSQFSSPRHDRVNVAGVEMDYQILRHTSLMLNADRGSRSSNTLGWSYTYNDVTLSLEQKF